MFYLGLKDNIEENTNTNIIHYLYKKDQHFRTPRAIQ